MRAKIILPILAIFGAALVGAYLARAQIASYGGTIWLQNRFGVPADLAFGEIDLGHAAIHRLRIGDANDVMLEDLELDYHWRDLLSGKIDGISIARLRANVTVDENGGVRSKLFDQFLLSGDGGTSATLPARVRVDEATITVDSTHGSFVASGQVALDHDHFSTTGTIADADQFSLGHWQLETAGFPANVRWSGEISATFDWHSPIWAFFPKWQPTRGNLSLHANFSGLDPKGPDFGLAQPVIAEVTLQEFALPGLPSPIDGNVQAELLPHESQLLVSNAVVDVVAGSEQDLRISASGNGEFALIAGGEGSASLTLHAAAAAPNYLGWSAQDLVIDLPISLTADGGMISVNVDGPGNLRGNSLKTNGGEIWPGSISATLPAQEKFFELNLTDGSWKCNSQIAATLHAPEWSAPFEDWRASELSAELPLQIIGDTDRVSVNLTAPAAIRANKVGSQSRKSALTSIAVSLAPGASEFASYDFLARTLSLSFAAQVGAGQANLQGEQVKFGKASAQAEIHSTGKNLGWSAKGIISSLTMPTRAWSSGKLNFDLKGDNQKLDFTADIDQLAVSADLVKINMKGKGRLKSGQLSANIRMSALAATVIDLGQAHIEADLAKSRAKIDLDLGPLKFDGAKFQPATLAPRLKRTLRDISGSVEIKGSLDWRAGVLTPNLRLGLQKISGEAGPVVFVNLNGVIDIDRLSPISTKPDQALAVEQVVSGLPMRNALLRFKLDGDEVSVREGRLELAGGTVTLAPTTVSLVRPGQQMFLQIDKLSVSELFKLAGVAGLSGEGDVSGQVPVTLFPDGIIIADASLSADHPGILRYDRAQAPAALASAGQSVDLALSALSNFHYKELIVRLDRKLTGDAVLALHIAGENPNFYEGYPVEFNLTLTGKLDEAVRKGLAGYQLPTIIEERLKDLQK